MFTSIFQSLSEGIGSLLDSLVDAFIGALSMDLGAYLVMFPLLANVYSILQSIAIGLILVIAGKTLATFWLGSVDQGQIQDRPVNVLLRSFIAAIGVYFGGYILAFITKMGTIPFDTFKNLNGNATISSNITSGAARIGSSVGDLGLAILNLLLLLLIAINLFKLMVEVCERYMMVGLLVFTSPIAYPTLSTKQSSRIFRSWWGMFVGAIIMMSASVLFLKLIVNGLANASNSTTGASMSFGDFFVRMVIILATCKIAQRVDSYLQQLGLNVATTGGSMVDEMMALANTLRSRFGSRGGGSKENTLGANRDSASLGSRSLIRRGLNKAQSDYAAGKSARESFKAGVATAGEGLKKNTAIGQAVTRGSEALKQARADGTGGLAAVGKVAKAAGAGAAVGAARHVYNTVAPGKMATHDGLKTGVQEKVAEEKAKRDTEKGIGGSRGAGLNKPSNGQNLQNGGGGNSAASNSGVNPAETDAAAGIVDPGTAAEAAVVGAAVSEVRSDDTVNTVPANTGAEIHDSSVRNVGDEALPKSVQDKVDSDKEIKPEEAKNNLENYGVTEGGNAFVTDTSAGEGDDSSVAIPSAAVAAGAAIEMNDKGEEYVSGPAETVGAWMNAASERANSIPENVGNSRLSDDSIGDAAARNDMKQVDRADFAGAANDMVAKTIDHAPPAALEAALDGKNALSGDAKMAEAMPKPIAPQGANESDADYAKRYTTQAKENAAAFDNMSSQSGSVHSFNMAQKYFGAALPAGAKMTGYKAVNVPAAQGASGSGPARTHQITYNDANGQSHTMELSTANAIAPAAKTSGSYGSYTSASGATYYSKDISGSRVDNGANWSRPEQTPVSVAAPVYAAENAQAPAHDYNSHVEQNSDTSYTEASSGNERHSAKPEAPGYAATPIRDPMPDFNHNTPVYQDAPAHDPAPEITRNDHSHPEASSYDHHMSDPPVRESAPDIQPNIPAYTDAPTGRDPVVDTVYRQEAPRYEVPQEPRFDQAPPREEPVSSVPSPAEIRSEVQHEIRQEIRQETSAYHNQPANNAPSYSQNSNEAPRPSEPSQNSQPNINNQQTSGSAPDFEPRRDKNGGPPPIVPPSKPKKRKRG